MLSHRLAARDEEHALLLLVLLGLIWWEQSCGSPGSCRASSSFGETKRAEKQPWGSRVREVSTEVGLHRGATLICRPPWMPPSCTFTSCPLCLHDSCLCRAAGIFQSCREMQFCSAHKYADDECSAWVSLPAPAIHLTRTKTMQATGTPSKRTATLEVLASSG